MSIKLAKGFWIWAMLGLIFITMALAALYSTNKNAFEQEQRFDALEIHSRIDSVYSSHRGIPHVSFRQYPGQSFGYFFHIMDGRDEDQYRFIDFVKAGDSVVKNKYGSALYIYRNDSVYRYSF